MLLRVNCSQRPQALSTSRLRSCCASWTISQNAVPYCLVYQGIFCPTAILPRAKSVIRITMDASKNFPKHHKNQPFIHKFPQLSYFCHRRVNCNGVRNTSTRHTAIVQFAVSLIEALYVSHTNGSAVTAARWVPHYYCTLPIESESPRGLCACANKWNIIMRYFGDSGSDLCNAKSFKRN